MFWLLFAVFTVGLFIWMQRTDTGKGSLVGMISTALVLGFFAAGAVWLAAEIMTWLFWPVVVVVGLIVLYLAFFSKKDKAATSK